MDERLVKDSSEAALKSINGVSDSINSANQLIADLKIKEKAEAAVAQENPY